MIMTEHSCGTVLMTVINDKRHYILVKTPEGSCGFPKGHIESGESEEQTALRETWEETCVRAKLIPGFREMIKYTLPNGNRKDVVYFAATFKDQTPKSNSGFELLHILVLPFGAALRALTHNDSKLLLKKAENFFSAL